MSHEIEVVNGIAQHVYAGDVPWHGLGTQVSPDLSPFEMQQAAGLDWKVEKKPMFIDVDGANVDVGYNALVRSSDNSVLSHVSDTWNPVQNDTAFQFFNDFVTAGDMQMHTAGSLFNGKMVWALAKINDGFTVFGGDEIESYLLFSNPHQFGKSVQVQFTPIRVVCNNTLSFALDRATKQSAIRVDHRSEFNPAMVTEALGIASYKLDEYKQLAEFLGQRQQTKDTMAKYFNDLFPSASKVEGKVSRNADICMDLLDKQPGAEFAQGTMWSGFNAATYFVDHLAGRNDDSRISSAFFGSGAQKKLEALHTAKEYAYAS